MNSLKRFIFQPTTDWMTAVKFAYAALFIRLPGLFWGVPLVSTGPFMQLSFDEISVSATATTWLTNPALVRQDYLYGFVRELSLALSAFHLDPAVPRDVLFAGRGMNVLFGAATVFLLYLLARLVDGDRRTAMLAAGALALAPIHVINSHYATPTVSFVFWSYLSLYAFLLFAARGRAVHWLAGCAAAGAAVTVKFGFFCLVPLIYLAATRKGRAPLKYAGFAAFLLMFHHLNFGDLPWRRWTTIHDLLLLDNYAERLHPAWINPFVYLIDLVPSLGLPTFAGLAIFVVALIRRDPSAGPLLPPAALSKNDIRACLIAPFALYAVGICAMTSNFTRHLVLLTPILCLLAARGFRMVAARLESRGRASAWARILLLMTVYQLVSVAWIERHHLANRVHDALQWVTDNVKAGEKVYICERTAFEFEWTSVIPSALLTIDPDQADYVVEREILSWRFRRSPLTPLDRYPHSDKVYHYEHVRRAPFLADLAAGRAPFRPAAEFRATEIMPEFRLFKRMFHTFNFEYGDVIVHRRMRE